MATQKPPLNVSAQGSVMPCQAIQNKINAKLSQLDMWQGELEILLSDSNSDIKEIGTLRDVLDGINKDLVKLKTEKRVLNCPDQEKFKIATDNQTIISTSSVRRKDRFALALPVLANTNIAVSKN